jgi:NADPH:quinone reductase-like Zn-dependent oxidoreductase
MAMLLNHRGATRLAPQFANKKKNSKSAFGEVPPVHQDAPRESRKMAAPTMRAWIVTRNGGPKEALELKPSWPAPPPPTGANVLIKVLYATLNPADTHFIANIPIWLPFRRTPAPGLDFVGEVIGAGPSATYKVGDVVGGALAVSLVFWGKGSLVECLSVPSSLVAKKPERLSLQAASGLLGIAGQTAALCANEAGLKKGNRVLVHGASGGVGTILIQAAKGQGAIVTAVCSGENAALVKKLGADEVRILYCQTSWNES